MAPFLPPFQFRLGIDSLRAHAVSAWAIDLLRARAPFLSPRSNLACHLLRTPPSISSARTPFLSQASKSARHLPSEISRAQTEEILGTASKFSIEIKIKFCMDAKSSIKVEIF